MKKKFLLGLVAMLLPLGAWADEQLEGSIPELEFIIKLDNATDKDGKSEIVYKGETVNPGIVVTWNDGEDTKTLDENSDYAVSYSFQKNSGGDSEPISKNQIKNVGTYTITITGLKTYKLAKEATATFSITPVTVTKLDIADAGVTKEYGTLDENIKLEDYITSVTGLVGDDKIADVAKCVKLVRVNDDGLETDDTKVKGNYRARIIDNGNKDNNYIYNPGTSQTSEFNLNITPKKVTVTLNDKAYLGRPVNMANFYDGVGTLYTFGENDIVGEDEVKLASLTENNNKVVKDAGNYTFTGTLDNENYVLANANNISLKILKADLDITLNDDAVLAKTYDGKNENVTVTSQFDIDGYLGSDEEDLNLSLVAKINGTTQNGGAYNQYEIVLYSNGKEVTELTNYNYEIPEDGQYYAITGKVLTSDAVAVTTDDDLLLYQGKAFEYVEDLVTVKDGDNLLTKGTHYDVELITTLPKTEDAKATNAGDKFKVKITGKDNYAGTELTTDELTIGKRTLTIALKENVTLGKTYGDAADSDEDLIDKFNITGWPKDANGTDLEGPNTDGVNLSMMRDRGKKELGEDGEDAGSYLVYPAKDGKAFYPGVQDDETTFTNYEISYPGIDENQFVIKQKNLTYKIAGAKKTYDGYPNTLPAFTITSSDFLAKDLDEDGNYKEGVFDVAPIVALTGKASATVGTYSLEVTNAAEAKSRNYALTYVGNNSQENGKYEITKADLTIEVLPQTIQYIEGKEANLDIKLVYNKNNDATATVFVHSTFRTTDKNAVEALLADHKLAYAKGVSAQMVGEHKGGLTLDVDDTTLELVNFNIDFKAGDLIVEGKTEITLDALAEEGDEDNVYAQVYAYNGQTLKEVTIKNLKNNFAGDDTNYETDQIIKAERWYTLVLPFDVTVSELSRKFGYAIVNIPNTDNDKAGYVYFKLHMQTIPANTLMAFKVAEDMEWSEIEGITFKNKTIVAPIPSEEWTGWATDGANNEFLGVYSPVEIDGEKEYFLNPKTGDVTRASAVLTQKGHAVAVYPLNGYIHTVSNDARFFMEEADGTVTAINAVTGKAINNAAEGWYTIGGVKLNGEPTEKGIYINNGVKVVIK